jgi:hypothetical protein
MQSVFGKKTARGIPTVFELFCGALRMCRPQRRKMALPAAGG